MKKYCFLFFMVCAIHTMAVAQDESYRGGIADGNGSDSLLTFNPYASILMYSPFFGSIADGHGHDSLINHPQYATINMFAPYRGSIGDGYAHDSLIAFGQRDYIGMFMPFGGGQADGWTSYPVFNIIVLPVELLSFSGSRQDQDHLLSWQTSQEQNTSHFDIERSSNGTSFTKIGSTVAAGNSSTLKNYAFTDAAPVPGNNFYRLKMTDLDGSFKYSNIILLKQMDDATMMAIYPNPATESLHITLGGSGDNSPVQANIYDVNGKLVKTSRWINNHSIQKIELGSLTPGVYMLRVISKNDNTVWRFIKQ